MATSYPKILLTGATGYIGGTLLNTLLGSFPSISITCLVRGAGRAEKLTSNYGSRVNTVLYADLDDTATTTRVASQHDIVFGTTPGYHSDSAHALLRGLAIRKAETKKDVWMIHLSGTSNLADQPLTGTPTWIETRELNDAEDDIYTYQTDLQKRYAYIQRTCELSTINLGLELGVKVLVMQAPTIFGRGTGLFNNISIQVPTYIRTTLELGHAITIWEGKGVHDYVHVEDLADLYVLVLSDILENEGSNLPQEKQAIVFSGSGRFSWAEVARRAAEVCYKYGKIKEAKVEDVSLKEGTKLLASYLPDATEEMVEMGLVSNSRTVAKHAENLGWKPKRLEEAWTKGFEDDLRVILERAEN